MRRDEKYKIAVIGILIIYLVIAGCRKTDMQNKDDQQAFSVSINSDEIDDMKLTIYYMDPLTLTIIPLSVDVFLYGLESTEAASTEKNDENGMYDYKIVIQGEQLIDHVGLLDQIGATTLIPVKKESYVNTRIYYVLEYKNGEKIFDVAVWGANEDCTSIFVNG